MNDKTTLPITPYPHPDYEAMIQELLRASRHARQIAIAEGILTPHSSRYDYVHYYGVGVRGIRQSGKTRFAAMAMNDTTICVTTNKRYRELFIDRPELKDWDPVQLGRRVMTGRDVVSGEMNALVWKIAQAIKSPQSVHEKAIVDEGFHLLSQDRKPGSPSDRQLQDFLLRGDRLQLDDDHPLRTVQTVIVDEVDHIMATTGATLSRVGLWSRLGGQTPEIIGFY